MSPSIWNLFKRRGADAPAPRGEPRLAQELVDRGISLKAAGELDAAMASYERAIAIDPQHAAAHYNLGLAHLTRSTCSEAEESFRSAVRIRDDFPEAWVALAYAQETLGRDEDALSALEKAIALRGDYAGALINSSALLHRMGRFEAAAAKSRRLLELQPENHEAQYTLATSLHELGRLTDAESAYRRTLALKPDFAQAKLNLAVVLQTTGRTGEAIPLLFDVAANDPADLQVRRLLVELLNGFVIVDAGEKARNTLLSLCLDDNVSTIFLMPSIVAVMKNNEAFRALQGYARRGEEPFAPALPAVAAFLRDPLVLAALPRMPFADVEMEEVLAYLRRHILLRCEATGMAGADGGVPEAFACALARQYFLTGYASFADEHELRRVAALREKLQGALEATHPDPRTLEPLLAVAALYDSLHALQGCGRLFEVAMDRWSEAFRPIVREHLVNRKREAELARQLTSITAIRDGVSLAVRAQYEEHPYPRWVMAPNPRPSTLQALARQLRPGREGRVRAPPVPVLVAGCGTGHHCVQVARGYPESEILAVDLSLASLAYAARMTEELGISTITYRQADILELGNLGRRFAVIQCGGVLHHLDDPMAGWRVLADLLEPDGLMLIALYSEKARGCVRAARELVRSMNLPPTAEGIRRFRRAIVQLPDGHEAKGVIALKDFFTLEECRDLVMHVREHQFTLPRIAQCLDELGLQFLGFECTAATKHRFSAMFPDAGDLAAWDRFEDAYPDTFTGMYTFWCCRKESV